MNAATITITLTEYATLVDAQNMLSALENAGVDSWEGYEYAQELYEGMEE